MMAALLTYWFSPLRAGASRCRCGGEGGPGWHMTRTQVNYVELRSSGFCSRGGREGEGKGCALPGNATVGQHAAMG